MTGDCFICGDLSGDSRRSGIIQIYGLDLWARSILWLDADFALIPGPGSIAAGYLILCTRSHVQPFAALSAKLLVRTDDIVARVIAFAEAITRLNYVFFEHGSWQVGAGPACINHGHIHICPTPDDAWLKRQLDENFDSSMLTSFEALPAFGQRDYILFGTASAIHRYETPHVASQLMRKLVAQQWEKPDKWDWRTNPEVENFARTVESFRQIGSAL